MPLQRDRTFHLAVAVGIIAVAVRFIDINQPFVDQWSWRQSDVAAIARNYLQNNFCFAYPQIDWAGDQPGYVGTEFPILPYVAAIAYKYAGVHEWIGRGESVILFATSLPFFFLLVRRSFGSVAATWALFFYGFAPLHIMASRCFMPDGPSLDFAIIGLYFFAEWLENGGAVSYLASAFSISLSILLKAPNAIIGAPLLYFSVAAVSERRTCSSDGRVRPAQGRQGLPLHVACLMRWQLWVFAAIALIPSMLWYWHAYQVSSAYYPYHFFGAGGFSLMSFHFYSRIAGETFGWSLTPILSILTAIGVVRARTTRGAGLFYFWLVALLLFAIVCGYGNRHPWYRLPLVPIAAAFAGFACSQLQAADRRRVLSYRTIACAIIVLFAVLCYFGVAPRYRGRAVALRSLGLELKESTPPNALIVAADYGDPSVFYYAERRGWHFLETGGIYNGHPITSQDAIDDLELLKKRGATHFVLYTDTFWWLGYYKEFAQYLAENTTLIAAPSEFRIYRLSAAGTGSGSN